MSKASASGIFIGTVIDLNDPLKLGRVKVCFPMLNDQKSDWARIVTLMAGPERGLYLIPEVGDEVLVAFDNGDTNYPYILGAVWSQADKPPATDGQPKKNNWRFLKSRSGHILKMDDTQGAEKIEIIDKTGNNSVVFDAAKNTITIKAAQTIKVEAPTVEVSGQSDVNIHAPKVSIKGDATLSVQAPKVDIKADAQMTI